MTNRIDIGSGFYYSFFRWAPDWSINTRKPGQPGHIDKAGIIVWRLEQISDRQIQPDDAPEGYVWDACGSCWFDVPETKLAGWDGQVWELRSLSPLHIEPSIQMYENDGKTPSWHGFIRGGEWVSA